MHGVTVTAKLDRTAAWLLVPRLAWLAYASYVSVATAIRSPDDLLQRTATAPANDDTSSTNARDVERSLPAVSLAVTSDRLSRRKPSTWSSDRWTQPVKARRNGP
ncbi:TspO/MBR family protein [Corallococcus praedator]|uniref:TspO/MBR family protein n=1 Tax=Corallococcus praedator TaxID=2316724 RepID=UPI003F6DF194